MVFNLLSDAAPLYASVTPNIPFLLLLHNCYFVTGTNYKVNIAVHDSQDPLVEKQWLEWMVDEQDEI